MKKDVSCVITHTAAVTPAGTGMAEQIRTLYNGIQHFSLPEHFDSRGTQLGVIHSLDRTGSRSRALALLKMLRDAVDFPIPEEGTKLFLATTVGAVDLLEQGEVCDGTIALLEEAKTLFGIGNATLIAAACASGQTAAAVAMEQLKNHSCDHALVIGCDAVSEFVTTGFTALGATAGKDVCRPYDTKRCGLTLGEAACALLLTRQDLAENGIGRIVTVAENCDASHITAPDLEGTTLRKAIAQALDAAGGSIGGIIGHGTGTLYNDLAEVNALSHVFGNGENVPPLFSLKGNFGHTLGATGVLQIALGLEISRRKLLPPQAGLREGMIPSVSKEAQELTSGRLLSLNVGFGGLNNALILEAL